MPLFKIPCTFQMSGVYAVEANDLREAIKKTEHISELPENREYIPDSLILDDIDLIFENNNMNVPCLTKEEIIEELNKRTDPRIHGYYFFNEATAEQSTEMLVALLRDYYNFNYEY